VSERPPERVRVTGPPRRRTTRPDRPRRSQIDDATLVGEIYLTSLLREQLRLGLTGLAVVVLGLGIWPLLFWLSPDLAEVRLLGFPLPWVVIGFAVYPFLWLVGWWFVRAAERNEEDFAALVETRERP
jgi:hypothetical protein